MFDKDSEFGALIQQAAALKTEQVKADRRVFESQPVFLQNTLFQCKNDQVSAARAMEDPLDRMEIAQSFKVLGNQVFASGDMFEANHQYEHCIGCFWYIATTETDWKSKGVKDEHLSYRKEGLELDAVRSLVVSCLNNIAMCQTKLENWSLCITACDSALEFDPTNVKALFRRAQARTLPASSGAVELEQALEDMKRAVRHAPQDKTVRKRFEELCALKRKQRELDKKTFTGMFERGDLFEEKDEENSNRGSNKNNDKMKENEKQVRQQIEFYRDMAISLKHKGREQDAQEIEKVIKSTEQKLETTRILASGDVLNPTPEMIQDAKENYGLDLCDPAVQQELQRMVRERSKSGVQSDNLTTQHNTPLKQPPYVTILAIALLATLFSYFF